jgi:hypothetical protein
MLTLQETEGKIQMDRRHRVRQVSQSDEKDSKVAAFKPGWMLQMCAFSTPHVGLYPAFQLTKILVREKFSDHHQTKVPGPESGDKRARLYPKLSPIYDSNGFRRIFPSA